MMVLPRLDELEVPAHLSPVVSSVPEDVKHSVVDHCVKMASVRARLGKVTWLVVAGLDIQEEDCALASQVASRVASQAASHMVL